MRALVILVSVVVAAAALPTNEVDVEGYLDWPDEDNLSRVHITPAEEGRSGLLAAGCVFRLRNDLGNPQPVYIHRNNYMMPTGLTSEVRLAANEQIRISCPGQFIRHPNIINQNTAIATATCVNGVTISGAGWLRANGPFGGLTCTDHLISTAQSIPAERCFGNRPVIRVGFNVDGVFHVLYRSCFDAARMEVLYVWYTQTAQNDFPQPNVDRPLVWEADNFFPGVVINTLYTENYQRTRINNIVNNNMYITPNQFLSRGHLSAKSDHIFGTAQRATFHFINAAPQWLTINNGNWNILEQTLRTRIRVANYNTQVYTGTFGVLQLRDPTAGNVQRFIYLHNNGRQVPVPLYFYKAIYDARLLRGTAFVTINNPYCSPAEALAMQRQLCPSNSCHNNNAANWLNWQATNITRGYSFCCTIREIRTHIQHIPATWNVNNGLLL